MQLTDSPLNRWVAVNETKILCNKFQANVRRCALIVLFVLRLWAFVPFHLFRKKRQEKTTENAKVRCCSSRFDSSSRKMCELARVLFSSCSLRVAFDCFFVSGVEQNEVKWIMKSTIVDDAWIKIKERKFSKNAINCDSSMRCIKHCHFCCSFLWLKLIIAFFSFSFRWLWLWLFFVSILFFWRLVDSADVFILQRYELMCSRHALIRMRSNQTCNEVQQILFSTLELSQMDDVAKITLSDNSTNNIHSDHVTHTPKHNRSSVNFDGKRKMKSFSWNHSWLVRSPSFPLLLLRVFAYKCTMI